MKIIPSRCLSALLICLAVALSAGGTASVRAAQSILSSGNGNPILPGFFADPEMFVINGKFYIYGTTDGYDLGGLETGSFVGWSSSDFVNWQATVFDYPAHFPVTSTKNWAPSLSQGPDGRYYFYYISAGYNCFVASSATPLGPWQSENGNNPIWPNMFDTCSFQDTDGSTWLVFMGPMTNGLPAIYAGKLSANMTNFVSDPVVIYQNADVFEGPTMFKRNGIYYLNYSNGSLGGTYNTRAAYATSITGPYTGNNPKVILTPNSSLNYSATGGGRITQVGDRFFMVYHRMSYPNQGAGWRQICVDEVKFNADGTNINQIVETYDGVGALAPLTITAPNLACGATATASSYQGTSYLPSYAVDQNHGSKWKASANAYPQWLQVDLGTNRAIASVATAFEYFTEYYQYTIQYSTNAVNWFTYADRSANTALASPLVDSNSVSARYLKLNVTYCSKTNQSPGVWEFKVYPPPSAALAPVGVTATAGSNQVVLNWTASAGAAAYCVQRSIFSGGPYVMVGYGLTGTNFTDAGLNNGKTYYVVSAIDSAGAVGTNSAEVSATPAIPTVPVTLVHRYNFSETSGTNCADSVGGAAWNGWLPRGGTYAGGQLTLSSNRQQYVRLPAGILSNYAAVTIEAWATFPKQIQWNTFFFGFGNTNGSSGNSYIFCAPQGGRIAITSTNWSGEQSATSSFDFSFRTNLHVVAVFNPPQGYIALYTNGVLAAFNSSVTVPFSSISNAFSYIARSLYSGDTWFDVKLDEFRIYNGAMQAADIAAAQIVGPNVLLTTNVSLGAAASGGSLTMTWPVAGSGFTLESSPTLGSGAVWTPASATPTVIALNNRVSIAPTNAAMFFRLRR